MDQKGLNIISFGQNKLWNWENPPFAEKRGIRDLLGHPGGLWRLRHAMVAHLNQFTSHCFDARVLPGGSYSFLSKYTSHTPGQSYDYSF